MVIILRHGEFELSVGAVSEVSNAAAELSFADGNGRGNVEGWDREVQVVVSAFVRAVGARVGGWSAARYDSLALDGCAGGDGLKSSVRFGELGGASDRGGRGFLGSGEGLFPDVKGFSQAVKGSEAPEVSSSGETGLQGRVGGGSVEGVRHVGLECGSSGVVGSPSVLEVGKGPKGGVSFGRGRNYQKNKKKREKKYSKSGSEVDRPDDSVDDSKVPEWRRAKGPKGSLRASLEMKWESQNRLAVLKAQKEIDVLNAMSETAIEEETRLRRAKLCAITEKNLVSVQRYHNSLSGSGDVTPELDSRVNTIISGSSTISPNSSASLKQFNDCVKEKEKAIAKWEQEKKNKEELSSEFNDVVELLRNMGVTYSRKTLDNDGIVWKDYDNKSQWTLSDNGKISSRHEAALERICGGEYGYYNCLGEGEQLDADGKMRVSITY